MIETLCSLKIVLLVLISILILDEIFLAQQTAETANFFASRSHLVGQDMTKVDDFFNSKVLKFFIFTKNNPFFFIFKIQTYPKDKSGNLTTSLQVSSRFRSTDEMERSFQITATTKEIQNP